MRALALLFLKPLLPSWRFFEEGEYAPVLEFRSSVQDVNRETWRPAPPRPARKWHHLFLNSHGNLFLWRQSALHRFVSDLDDLKPGELERSSSYQNLAAWAGQLSESSTFQFRVLGLNIAVPGSLKLELFVSKELTK